MRSRRRSVWRRRSTSVMLATVTVAGGLAALGRTLPAQQAPPTFRAATEAIVIDVSVLDRNRQVVRGLTATDFTILEDGQAQALRTFKEIDLAGNTRPPEPVWSADHPADVRRNDELRNHSVVVIVLDGSTPMPADDILRAKAVGEKIVNQLEPGDLAAVVHTMDKPAGQDFTQDRELLRASVKRFSAPLPMNTPARIGGGTPAGPGPLVAGYLRADPMSLQDSGLQRETATLLRVTLSTLNGIAKTLAAVPEQRKALIFVSPGMPLDPSRITPQGMGDNGEEGALHNALFKELFAIIGEANRSNISFYAIDPGGLRVRPNPLCLDFLKSVSLDTGGLPVLNANDPTKQIAQIYRENQHYYLLGYQPSNPRTDGQFRKIEIRVNRTDATVRTRSGYYEPRKTSASPAPAAPRVTDALQGPLPLGDLPLAMTAACFAGRSGKRADVAVSVEASEVAPTGHPAATSEVEVAVHAYDKGWKLKASQRSTQRLAIAADPGQAVRYALLSRLELEPGRYQLRVAVQSSLTAHQGSVYYDVTVPDFNKGPLAASGIVLDVRPRTTASPAGAFASLLPFDPTARREFRADDQVTAMLRVYQRSRKEVLPVRLTARIVDAEGKVAWNADQALAREQFGAANEADYRVDLPVATLGRGQYLLELEASDGRATTRSDVRFRRE